MNVTKTQLTQPSFKQKLTLNLNDLKKGSTLYEGLRSALTPKEGELLDEVHKITEFADVSISKIPNFDVLELALTKKNKTISKKFCTERFVDEDTLGDALVARLTELAVFVKPKK